MDRYEFVKKYVFRRRNRFELYANMLIKARVAGISPAETDLPSL